MPRIDAAIVCSMLGFPGGAFSNRPSHYGMLAAGDFAMANVDCTGSIIFILVLYLTSYVHLYSAFNV